MTAAWDAAQAVNASRAADLVRAQFPELRGAPVRPLASGWDNSVLLVGDLLFRFPRREAAVALQARELAVLPLVADRVPLQVPAPTHFGKPAGDYPWPFWGAPMVPGHELALAGDGNRQTAGEAAGAFLRALHDVQVDVDLPIDPMHRGAPLLRAERTWQWLSELRAAGLWNGSAQVQALVDAPLGPPEGPHVLVHGDLHLRHLLVDGHGRATGVIDWGDTCLADPAVDLSLAYAAFTGRARDRMLGAYGPVDAEREVRARSLAVGLCAGLARWAAAVSEQRLLEEYLAGLQRAVE